MKIVHNIHNVSINDTTEVEQFLKSDLRLINNDWQLNWKQLFNSDAQFFKIVLRDEIQGTIKLEEENEAYYVLNNIEVAPRNYGSKGKYKNVAEMLMSYACFKTIELSKGNYRGFLAFTSKGALIEY